MRRDVLLIAHSYAQHNRIQLEMDAIERSGLRGDLICLRDDGEPARSRTGATTVRRLPIRRHRGAGLPTYLLEYTAFLVGALLLAAYLQIRHRYRVVIVHSLPDVLVFSALVPRLMGAQVVANLREFTPELVRTRYGVGDGHWLVRLTRFLESASCAFADRVITVHTEGVRLLSERGVPIDKLVVVTNAMVIEATASGAGGARGPFTLLYHGMIGNEYDLTTVVDALTRLRERGWTRDDVRLRIVGTGPELETLRRKVDEAGVGAWVAFEPPVPFERVPSILAAADAGVPILRETPYAHLGLPTKLLEYVAVHVPVVSVPGRAIRRYFGPDALCYVPFGDPDAVADAVETLRADGARRATMTDAAYAALQPIRREVNLARYGELFDELGATASARTPAGEAAS